MKEVAGLEVWVNVFNNKNPRVEASEDTKKMLEFLIARNIVSSYMLKNGFYRVNSKRNW